MAARSRIILYYDVVSPWSFVAFRTLRAYSRVWQKDVDFQLEVSERGPASCATAHTFLLF